MANRLENTYSRLLLSSPFARMAELVDAHDSNSCSARSVGSIPTSGTKQTKEPPHKAAFLFPKKTSFRAKGMQNFQENN